LAEVLVEMQDLVTEVDSTKGIQEDNKDNNKEDKEEHIHLVSVEEDQAE
jgi:hypothetical protein